MPPATASCPGLSESLVVRIRPSAAPEWIRSGHDARPRPLWYRTAVGPNARRVTETRSTKMTNLVDATPDLRTRISGEVIGSGDAAAYDRRPVGLQRHDRSGTRRFIARCAGVQRVGCRTALDAGRQASAYLPVAVPGWRTQRAGVSGTVDGGIVIDLSPMHIGRGRPRTTYGTSARRGATGGLVDAATREHGLATPRASSRRWRGRPDPGAAATATSSCKCESLHHRQPARSRCRARRRAGVVTRVRVRAP